MGEAGTAYDISYGIFEREGEVAYVDADGRLTFVGVAGERVRAIKKKNKKNKKKE